MRHDIPKLITPGVIHSSQERFYVYPSLAVAKRGLISSASIVSEQAQEKMSERLGTKVFVTPEGAAFRCLETQNYFRSISAAKVQFLDKTYPLEECWILYHNYTEFEVS